MSKYHLNLVLNEELVKKLKMRAIEEDRTVSEITEELYREYLKRPKKAKEK